MIRKPVASVLLAAFLSGCSHRPGPMLPTPTSASDSVAIARIEAANPVFVMVRYGETLRLEDVHVEWPAVRGRDARRATGVLIPLDSIAALRAPDVDRIRTARNVLIVAGVVAVVGGLIWLATTDHPDCFLCIPPYQPMRWRR